MTSKFDLVTKLGICRKRGIDFTGADTNIDSEKRLKNINYIIEKIVNNPSLMEIFDEIDDEFWVQAIKTGILIYGELANTPYGKEEYLLAKKQQFYKAKFETIDGEKIEVDNTYEIPALVYQIKKNRF